MVKAQFTFAPGLYYFNKDSLGPSPELVAHPVSGGREHHGGRGGAPRPGGSLARQGMEQQRPVKGSGGGDWFALQPSDGRDLMYYQPRLVDGTADPLSREVLVGRDGQTQPLTSEMIELTVLERWGSPLGGDSCPSRWRVAIPGEDIELEVVPLLPDQELDLTFRYWAGALPGRRKRERTELQPC